MLISESMLKALLPQLSIKRSTLNLKTYTGESIPVKGSVIVDVTYGSKTYSNLELTDVDGERPCLLGRDWLSCIRLDWRQISKVVSSLTNSQDRLDALLSQYQVVFSDCLGTITPYQATLHLKEPRLREQVGKELDRLEKSGVLEKTTFCEWAAPIVVVPKKDGRLRICGDYKVTINPSLDVDQHPLPKPEDIFVSLSGGTKFTVLDLLQAYNQLLLDDHSKKLVTINTHQVL